MLVRTGADQTTEAPAPIRFSIFRRDTGLPSSAVLLMTPSMSITGNYGGNYGEAVRFLIRLRYFEYSSASTPPGPPATLPAVSC
jgi:hypothetical protein